MTEDQDKSTPLSKSRKTGAMLEYFGHDNPMFEIQSRKISSVSNHVDLGPVRKKSLMHRHENENGGSIYLDSGKQNGDTKKCSLTESEFSRTPLPSIAEEDNRSWWYLFCMKCRSKEEHPQWQPKYWSKFCPQPYFPSYRQFTRTLTLCLIGLFTWCVLYAIVGDAAAPPDGQLYQLILLSICSYMGGWLISLTTLPALIGMVFTGILLQNVNIVNIDDSFSEITKNVSHISLIIILIRAGLDLDPSALHRLKFIVPKLSLFPWCVEASASAVLSRYILGIPWKFAALLGVILAAVAPAVVVPCLFRLRAKSYGVAKGIPTLIIAVASIGDSTSVAVFGIMKAIIFSDSSLTSVILQGPISIVGGIGFGILWGMLCGYCPERNDPFVSPLRILLLLSGGMVSVFGSEVLGYGGAGPLACVAAAFVALVFWSKQGWEVDDNPAATAFEIFWAICQPILFGVSGARVRIHELDGSVVAMGVGVLVAGVLIRMLATTLISFGCRLNLKEKIFVSICWMCKGMVQAALGPVTLNLVAADSKEHEYAKRMLTVSILSIVVTAPTGAMLITLLGPRLLTKANLPPLPELRRRKRSRHLSILDIGITEEDKFKPDLEPTEEVSSTI